MAANPNPLRITDAEWRLWEQVLLVIPGVRLGGIYANKSGYHNTVDANQATWPANYSIRLAIDRDNNPQTKARAIDLTMSTAEMIKRTGYLKRSIEHPEDDRLGCLREVIGTLNGTTVWARIHDSPTGPWRISSADTTHLWHNHDSFFTLYCDDWDARPGVYGLEAVLSVLSGETWDAWKARKAGTTGGDDEMFCKLTDKGDKVRLMQRRILRINPALLPNFKDDADYGGETAAGLVAVGATVDGDATGNTYGPVEMENLDAIYSQHFGGAGQAGPEGPMGPMGPEGPKGDKGDPGQDGIGAGDSVTITGVVMET